MLIALNLLNIGRFSASGKWRHPCHHLALHGVSSQAFQAWEDNHLDIATFQLSSTWIAQHSQASVEVAEDNSTLGSISILQPVLVLNVLQVLVCIAWGEWETKRGGREFVLRVSACNDWIIMVVLIIMNGCFGKRYLDAMVRCYSYDVSHLVS